MWGWAGVVRADCTSLQTYLIDYTVVGKISLVGCLYIGISSINTRPGGL